ncbi:hypothetical protein L1857_07540 [Amycolatopsis thermalba]|uniref:PPE family domain-containing protein n=1 Tax=Amycolatopsis thermalba TaxID=944492 RepID=A0ABY4NRJ2_9PSEU|nr:MULTISPECIES: hypothetical protein [Amycolatopsis]UQS22681.1 hypothetical protein L1857_07540 [Amycolatopsis thermalba]
MTQPDNGYSRRRYESEVYAETAGKSAGKFFGPDAEAVAGGYSIKSGQIYTRKLQAEGGAYRDGLPPSDQLYDGVPHEQLKTMVTDGVSPEEVDEQGTIVNDLGNAFGEMASALRQGVAKEQAGWQGDGANSAFGYFNTLATWADSSKDAAFLSANRYSQTSAALSQARNSMPEPAGRSVEESVAAARQQLAGGDWQAATATMNDMQNQAALQHQAQQEAAAVLAQRDLMLHSGGSTQPVYATPTAQPDTGGTTTPQFAANDSTIASSSGGVGPMGGSPGGVRTVGSIAPPTVPLPGAGPTTGASPAAGFADHAGGWGRSPGTTVPGSSGTSAGAGMMPIAPGQADQTRTSPRPGAGAGRAGVPPRAGVGGRAAGGAAGRLGGAAGQEPAAGRKAGVGEPGARAAAESANSGRAGAAGKAGASGTGLAGPAGNSKKEEDKDHERPAYLLEDDPDSIFGHEGGTDENGNRISPPVIGG